MCKSQAEGGRCATHTRQELTRARAAFVESVLEANTAEVNMSARVDALAKEMGLADFTQVPDYAYESDEELSRLCSVMRDVDEESLVAKRAMSAAYVDHAITRTGRKEVEAMVVSAKDRGRAETAAWLVGLLHQADDVSAARARYAAVRQPQMA